MRRLSTFKLVFVIPTVAALLLMAVLQYRSSLLKEPLARYRSELEQQGSCHLGGIESDLGTDRTRGMLQAWTLRNRTAALNGDRFAQVIAAQHTGRNADGIALYVLNAQLNTTYTYGLEGTRIHAVSFDGEDLLVAAYGSLRFFDRQVEIPKSNPEVYQIRWPKDPLLTDIQHLNSVMLERHFGGSAGKPR